MTLRMVNEGSRKLKLDIICGSAGSEKTPVTHFKWTMRPPNWDLISWWSRTASVTLSWPPTTSHYNCVEIRTGFLERAADVLGIWSYPTPQPHLKSVWGASLRTWGNNGFNFDSTERNWRVGRIWHWDTKSCHLMNVLKSAGQGVFVISKMWP